MWCKLRHHRITKMLEEVPREMPETFGHAETTALWQSFLEARKNVLGKKKVLIIAK